MGGVRERASALGVATGFHDGTGRWHDVSETTLAAVVEGLGEPAADPDWPPVLVAYRGRPLGRKPWRGAPVSVVLESGEECPLPAYLPGDLPDGYHRIVGRTGSTALVVVPPRCHLPPSLVRGGRVWGWAVQVYALRSRTSWGVGDLGDLAALAADRSLRGGFTMVNPLNVPPTAAHPGLYRPSTRLFRNPLYLDVEQVPECAALRGPVRDRFDRLAAAGRRLTRQDLIDRPAVLAIKDEALRLGFTALDALPARRSAFEAWRAGAPMIDTFAAFRVLQGVHGDDWRVWPAELRAYSGTAVADLLGRHADEARYQAWLQWLLETQLAAVPTAAVGVISDFPIGVARGGFDAWAFGGDMARGLTVGAPPDAFAPHGQDWRQATFSPVRLTATAYAPFVRSLRVVLTGAGGVRIDHVMGLSRLFLIPDGGSPADGTYVRFPFEDLLGVLALESHRAGALVVGEDLGTVEPGVRDRLAAANVLSSRVMWFERHPHDAALPRPAADYPPLAVATVGTHDLATVAGEFTDADLHEQHDLGLVSAEQFGAAREGGRHRQRQLLDLLRREGLLADGEVDVTAVTLACHLLLARTPAMLVAVRLEDALEVLWRTNMPGTSREQRPLNWSSPLPALLEDLSGDPRVARLVAALRAAV